MTLLLNIGASVTSIFGPLILVRSFSIRVAPVLIPKSAVRLGE